MIEVLYDPPSLTHLMQAGRWDIAEKKLAYVYEQLRLHVPDSRTDICETGFAIAGVYHYFAHMNGKYLSKLSTGNYNDLLDGSAFCSTSQLISWADHTFHILKESKQADDRLSRGDLITKAQVYIENHLDGDVSLQSIASHVYMHSTHFSKVYKQETGEGISKYIYRLRMEKTRYLLTNTSYKIYEIGRKVGFPNAAYFINVFKKEFGNTPQEYRERLVPRRYALAK